MNISKFNNYSVNITILSILLVISILGYSINNFVFDKNEHIDLSNIFLKSIKGIVRNTSDDQRNIYRKEIGKININNEYFFIKKKKCEPNFEIKKQNIHNDLIKIKKKEFDVGNVVKKNRTQGVEKINKGDQGIKNEEELTIKKQNFVDNSYLVNKDSQKNNSKKTINIIDIEEKIRESHNNKISTVLENNYYERDINKNEDEFIENKLTDLNKHMKNLIQLSNDN